MGVRDLNADEFRLFGNVVVDADGVVGRGKRAVLEGLVDRAEGVVFLADLPHSQGLEPYPHRVLGMIGEREGLRVLFAGPMMCANASYFVPR